MKWNKYVGEKLDELLKSREVLLKEFKANDAQDKSTQDSSSRSRSYLKRFRSRLHRRGKADAANSQSIESSKRLVEGQQSLITDPRESEVFEEMGS